MSPTNLLTSLPPMPQRNSSSMISELCTSWKLRAILTGLTLVGSSCNSYSRVAQHRAARHNDPFSSSSLDDKSLTQNQDSELSTKKGGENGTSKSDPPHTLYHDESLRHAIASSKGPIKPRVRTMRKSELNTPAPQAMAFNADAKELIPPAAKQLADQPPTQKAPAATGVVLVNFDDEEPSDSSPAKPVESSTPPAPIQKVAHPSETIAADEFTAFDLPKSAPRTAKIAKTAKPALEWPDELLPSGVTPVAHEQEVGQEPPPLSPLPPIEAGRDATAKPAVTPQPLATEPQPVTSQPQAAPVPSEDTVFHRPIPRDDSQCPPQEWWNSPAPQAACPCPPTGPPKAWRPAPTNANCPAGTCPQVACPRGKMPEWYAEEYVCDGGDQGTPIHYRGDRVMYGLDPEDTAAQYVDRTGKRRVLPTNQVCIYAPRFGAVRAATLPVIDSQFNHLAGTQDQIRMAGVNSRLRIDEERQRERLASVSDRNRAGRVDADLLDANLAQDLALRIHSKLINLHQSYNTLWLSQMDTKQKAFLKQALVAAGEWTRPLNPIIVASDVTGNQINARFKVEEYVGVEDQNSPGQLKIVKLANTSVASPGDEVTFTIHFENLGGKELCEVQIVDNLSPRLELVQDSVTKDIEGELQIEDNREGSVKLTFTLNAPLPAKTGGTLTFRCTVR